MKKSVIAGVFLALATMLNAAPQNQPTNPPAQSTNAPQTTKKTKVKKTKVKKNKTPKKNKTDQNTKKG